MLQIVEYLVIDENWGADWLRNGGLQQLVAWIQAIAKQLKADIGLQVIAKILKLIRKGLIGYASALQAKEDIISANNLVLMKNLTLDVISMVIEIKKEENLKNNTMQEEKKEDPEQQEAE